MPTSRAGEHDDTIVQQGPAGAEGDQAHVLYNDLIIPGDKPPEGAGAELVLVAPDTTRDESLFWTVVTVNRKRVWGLLDTGAARNIISEKLLGEVGGGVNLDVQDRGGIRVGNGAILHIAQWILLKVEFAGVAVLHKFAVVPNITVPLVIGNEILRPHCGRLTYSVEGKPLVELEYRSCALCRANHRTALQTESEAFLLPEAVRLSEQEKFEKVCT
jgi:hypothetical protein